MDNLKSEEKNEEKAEVIFHQMMENGDFQIISIPSNNIDFRGLKKPEISTEQKIQISGLLQQLSSVFATGAMASAYRVEFPKGIAGSLMKLKQGGYSTTLKDANNKIIGTASLYSMGMEAAILGAFTAMSVVTGQFFLAQINKELKMINEKIDQILQFLYGDKKAELISEVSFVKYACENYGSIMTHAEQRTATISGLQEARKVAMKDIEFYLNDLEELGKRKILKQFADIIKNTGNALQIENSLDLSIQLYVMSSLLEIYYAQNFDADYVNYVKEDVNSYLEMCKSNMLSSFARIEKGIPDYKPYNYEKDEFNERIQKVKSVSESLKVYGSDYRKLMQGVWQSLNQRAEYYFTPDGDVYLKAAL